jgi:hypothetical protein
LELPSNGSPALLQNRGLARRFHSWWILDSKPYGYGIVQFHRILAKIKHDFSRPFQEGASKVRQWRLIHRGRGEAGIFELWVNFSFV